MTGMQVAGSAAARLASGPARVAALAAAGGVGVVGAHVATDRGDYQHNRIWQKAAAATTLAVGAGAVALGSRGSRMAQGALDGSLPLAREAHRQLLLAASTGADDASAALANAGDAITALERQVHAASRSSQAGVALVQGAGMLGVGAATGIMLTSARLDPGILHVQVDHNVSVDTKSWGEHRADEARGVAGAIGSGASAAASAGGGVKDWLGQNVFNNPFG